MSTRKTPKLKAPPAPEYPKVIEVFGRPYLGSINQHDKAASAFNGVCHFRRYRITVEEIEEPVETLLTRLIELWETCDNHHHRECIGNAASKLGHLLPHTTFGIRSPRHRANQP